MAKKAIKKSASLKKTKITKAAPKAKAKKSAVKKSSVKKKATVKKVITEKEREIRAANLIANSEKKKTKTATKRPKRTLTNAQSQGLLSAIIEGMKEKKAKNIAVLNLSKIESRVSDFFVICDADSKIHVESIADSVEEIVEKLTGERAYHSEGQGNSEWILIDYVNIVVHVFLREAREHYNLEALWGDAEMELIN
ncbi:MAG: ribosome silencing factor [Sphingobacteriaceae bacterium]|nr:ribosome silencing factor [Sphingobacteriaceae bacterium]